VFISWNNKKCFDTVDARYKHEDNFKYVTFSCLVLLFDGRLAILLSNNDDDNFDFYYDESNDNDIT
jgi:hypothetical protein